MTKKLIPPDELKSKGILYHVQHVRKLVKQGLFPAPIHLGGGGRVAWVEEEIDRWIEEQVAKRDQRVKEAANA